MTITMSKDADELHHFKTSAFEDFVVDIRRFGAAQFQNQVLRALTVR